MQLSACLWGGIYNPIIPVCKVVPHIWTRALTEIAPTGLQLAKGYIEFFEPDVYVEATRGLSTDLGISNVDIEFGVKRIS